MESSLGASPSAAANRLQSLRDSLKTEAASFQYAIEKKTVALISEQKSTRQDLFLLDQKVSNEARDRSHEDAAIAAYLAQQLEVSQSSFNDFLQQHTSRIEGAATKLDKKVDQVLEETRSHRSSQDQLVETIRKDHHDTVEQLKRSLEDIRQAAVAFESNFSSNASASVRQAEDRLTIELSIRERAASDVRANVKALLAKNDAERYFESQTGSLMSRIEAIRRDFDVNKHQREESAAAFAETMKEMIDEVDSAVKAMNLSRGVEHLARKRQQLSMRTSHTSRK